MGKLKIHQLQVESFVTAGIRGGQPLEIAEIDTTDTRPPQSNGCNSWEVSCTCP